MKSHITVLFTTALTVFLSNPANSQGLVLQLNIESGALTPFPANTNEAGKVATTVSIPSARWNYKNRGSVQPSRSVLEAIEATARKYVSAPALANANLSPHEWIALYRANIEIESGYNPAAISKVGAIGLGQLMPETAAHLKVNASNPADNLRGSAEYLLSLLNTFGSPDLAIAAYNAGPDAVTMIGGVPPYSETREHVRKVLGAFFRLRKHYI